MDDEDFLTDLLYSISSVISTFTLLLVVAVIYVSCCSTGGIELGDGVPGAFDDLEQFQEEEANALEIMDDRSRQSYLMAKRWIDHNPPNSADSDISLSQFMAIQDKAVGAYEFTFDIRQQPSVFVVNRTEIRFQPRQLGQVASVQTNIPLLKEKVCYYWEVKIYDLEPDAKLAVGLTTKPYPLFRLPGLHRFSVAYDSTGAKRLNNPFRADIYGRPWQRGDVIGVGYRPSSGTIFFTHNGKRMDDTVQGVRFNVFPTVGCTGKADVYVNLGQDGFVYIPANVNSWGLAPPQGSLPPPPAYGKQDDSVLLESTTTTTTTTNASTHHTDEPQSAPVAGPSAPPYTSDDDLHTPPGSPPHQSNTPSIDGDDDEDTNQAASLSTNQEGNSNQGTNPETHPETHQPASNDASQGANQETDRSSSILDTHENDNENADQNTSIDNTQDTLEDANTSVESDQTAGSGSSESSSEPSASIQATRNPIPPVNTSSKHSSSKKGRNKSPGSASNADNAPRSVDGS